MSVSICEQYLYSPVSTVNSSTIRKLWFDIKNTTSNWTIAWACQVPQVPGLLSWFLNQTCEWVSKYIFVHHIQYWDHRVLKNTECYIALHQEWLRDIRSYFWPALLYSYLVLITLCVLLSCLYTCPISAYQNLSLFLSVWDLFHNLCDSVTLWFCVY